MKLTFNEAIENHRKMWNWIADETDRKKGIVSKEDYFKKNNIEKCYCYCYCCEYAKENNNIVDERGKIEKDCRICPIDWGIEAEFHRSTQCSEYNTLYDLWRKAVDLWEWKTAAIYASQIANLPVRQIT